MDNGYCHVISPLSVQNVSYGVGANHIRMDYRVPKIRPSDYLRTVLVYDFECLSEPVQTQEVQTQEVEAQEVEDRE